ncbi:hypothetical protein FH972_025425 [Carpinus fangiana]|uniref:F-box domain-containing protein n=1 Tax=Carpinus fangiana TaxID=176857 RepID=A0A5N6L141_9ROSI|nr:hypothetical protein FH972_025425 [Carpinus fangiana]
MEILHCIAEGLVKADLVSLCLVSQRFRYALLLRIYQQIEFQWEHDERAQSDAVQLSLVLLFRTVLSCPDLCLYVKSFKCYGTRPKLNWNDYDARQKYIPPPMSPPIWPSSTASIQFPNSDQHAEAITIVDSLPLGSTEEAQRWREDFVRGELELIIALLLLRLPKLESLHIGHDFFRTAFVDLALQCKADNGDAQSLRSICISADFRPRSARGYHNFTCFLPLVAIHSLESASLSLPAISMGHMAATPPSYLTSLHLQCSSLSETVLGLLLAQTPFLEDLRYDRFVEAREMPDDKPSRFLISHLSASLSHVRSSLRHLFVAYGSFSDDGDYTMLEWVDLADQVLEPLLSFDKLETVHAPYMLIFGWDGNPNKFRRINSILPPNVRSLTLNSDLTEFWSCEWEPEDLGYALELSVSFFANHRINGITSSVVVVEDCYVSHALNKAKGLFEAAGIQFELERRIRNVHD